MLSLLFLAVPFLLALILLAILWPRGMRRLIVFVLLAPVLFFFVLAIDGELGFDQETREALAILAVIIVCARLAVGFRYRRNSRIRRDRNIALGRRAVEQEMEAYRAQAESDG